MNRIDRRRPNLLAAVGLVLAAAGAGTASAVEATETGAAERVLATMRSAVEGAPEMVLRRSSLGAEAAEARAATGAGAPSLGWQREGIGSGFERKPNSADYFRVSLPFNPPWRLGANRDLRDAADQLLLSGDESSRVEVAAEAGRRWLDLAAEAELAELAEKRVGRLESAMATQTRRYDLGEISGFERTQLELAVARERAALRQAEVRRHAAEQHLAAVAPGALQPPMSGDLTRLANDTASDSPEDGGVDRWLAEAPALELAEVRLEVADAEAKSRRGRAWGRPEVEVEWERIPDFGAESGYDAAGVHLAVPLPLGRRGRQELLAAELRATAAAAERDRLERQLSAQVRSATEAARGAEAALDSLEGIAERLPANEHSLAEQFRLGAVSYVVYLDGLSRLDEIRRALIETHHSLLNARLELARLLGSDAYFPMPDLEGEGS